MTIALAVAMLVVIWTLAITAIVAELKQQPESIDNP